MNKIILFIGLFLGVFSTQAQPEKVKVGVFVKSIYDISMANGEYSTAFDLWFLHKKDSLEIEKNFEIANNKVFQIQSSSSEKVNGLNWVSAKIVGKMQQDWVTHNFPFDQQTLLIKLENTLYDSRQVVFEPDVAGSKLDKNFSLTGWQIQKFEIKHNPSKYETNYGDPSLSQESSEYSAVDILIHIKRNSWGLFFKVFLGLYIALLIASLVFLVPSADLNSKFGLAIGGLFAAVGNKYIVDSSLPESNAFTLSDQIHALTFSFILLYILLSAITHSIHNKGKEDLAKRVDRTLLWLAPVVYFLINVILVLRA
jgi:hypothetical protein